MASIQAYKSTDVSIILFRVKHKKWLVKIW